MARGGKKGPCILAPRLQSRLFKHAPPRAYVASGSLSHFVLTTASAWEKQGLSRSFDQPFPNTAKKSQLTIPSTFPLSLHTNNKKFLESIWDFNGSHF